MNLKEKYPKLFGKLKDKDVELRHLLNVDENYEDYDSEEFEFDFEEYNYIVYIAEPVQNALGKEKLGLVSKKFETENLFENFVASEEDLYGIKCDLSEDEMTALILSTIEEIV